MQLHDENRTLLSGRRLEVMKTKVISDYLVIHKKEHDKLPPVQNLWYEFNRKFNEYNYQFTRCYKGPGKPLFDRLYDEPNVLWVDSGCGNCNAFFSAEKDFRINARMIGITYEVHPQTDTIMQRIKNPFVLWVGEALSILKSKPDLATVITDFCGPYHYAYNINTYQEQIPIADRVVRKMDIITAYLKALKPGGQAYLRIPDRVGNGHPAQYLENYLRSRNELKSIISVNRDVGIFLHKPTDGNLPAILFDYEYLLKEFQDRYLGYSF